MSGKKLCLSLILACLLTALLCGGIAFCAALITFSCLTQSTVISLVAASIIGGVAFVWNFINIFKDINARVDKKLKELGIDCENQEN